MTYEIVFDADGRVIFPDLPGELLPAAEALAAPLPPPAAPRPTNGLHQWWHTRSIHLGITHPALKETATPVLWALHGAALKGASPKQEPRLRIDEALAEAGPARRERAAIADAVEAAHRQAATLLDLKIELARRALGSCDLCALRCGANRRAGERGACGSGFDARYTDCFINWSEERDLTPGISIFLSGCNWRCVYCQYSENLSAEAGTVVEPRGLALRVEDLWRRGGTTIHWLGGNPDQNVWVAIATLQVCQAPLPVVWNSNGYASQRTLRLLNGIVDTHIVDFRHWSSDCAGRYGAPPDSAAVIRRNLSQIAEQGSDLIVRHLQLPGHFECCTAPILRWLAQTLIYEKPGFRLNLMGGQYRPAHQTHRYPEINRRLHDEERHAVGALALDLGLRLEHGQTEAARER